MTKPTKIQMQHRSARAPWSERSNILSTGATGIVVNESALERCGVDACEASWLAGAGGRAQPAAVARLEALRDREAQVAAPVPITVGESWATLPDARKRALIASMVSVTVRRSTAANWTFDPSRVVLRWLH